MRARTVQQVFTGLVRLRYLLLVTVGAAAVIAANSTASLDWDLLAFAGQHGLSAFVDYPAVQIGPAAIPMFGVLAALRNPTALAAVIAVSCTIAAVRMIELTARASGVDRRRAAWASTLGGVAAIVAAAYVAGVWGHLEDVVAVTLMVAATCSVLRAAAGWINGALLGLAVAFKPWAVVAAGLLIVVPRGQQRAAWVTFSFVALVGWMPFLVVHPGTVHAVASYRATVRANSPMYVLGFNAGTHVPGWWRAAEVAGGAAAGLAAALRGRACATPLVGVAVRVGFDSAAFSYYGLAPVVLALLLDVTRGLRLTMTAGTVVALYVAPWVGTVPGEVARALWLLVVLLVGCLAQDRRGSEDLDVVPVAACAQITAVGEPDVGPGQRR